MNARSCKRVILAGAEGCRVTYCEDCRVAEVEIGAVSLRLEMQAFSSLSQMIQEAQSRLRVLDAAGSAFQHEEGLRHVH
jgi:hypothetical protein